MAELCADNRQRPSLGQSTEKEPVRACSPKPSGCKGDTLKNCVFFLQGNVNFFRLDYHRKKRLLQIGFTLRISRGTRHGNENSSDFRGGDTNNPDFQLWIEHSAKISTTALTLCLFAKWHHWHTRNKGESVQNSYLEVKIQPPRERRMLAVASTLLSRGRNCRALRIFSLKEKCWRSTRPVGCWAALRSPVSPLSIFRVCRGPCLVETRVGASRLALAPLVLRSRGFVFRNAANRVKPSKCPKKNCALSVVLKVRERQCGPGPRWWWHER